MGRGRRGAVGVGRHGARRHGGDGGDKLEAVGLRFTISFWSDLTPLPPRAPVCNDSLQPDLPPSPHF